MERVNALVRLGCRLTIKMAARQILMEDLHIREVLNNLQKDLYVFTRVITSDKTGIL